MSKTTTITFTQAELSTMVLALGTEARRLLDAAGSADEVCAAGFRERADEARTLAARLREAPTLGG